jgi:phage FluMu gp28-like protein
MNLSDRAQFLVDNLDLPEAAGVEDARWEFFQLAHLSDDSTFRIEDKSRQIAWSFTVAAEAIAEAILEKQGSVFVSINLDEAKEKIRYARQVFNNIQLSGLPRLTRDNELSLEFDNGARLISLPSKPPRGKARMNIYLDEFAHVQHDRQIYTAALPVISKGGRLRIGSSPLGASGVHWEISQQQLRQYPGYRRKRTPWWEVYAFCLNVREARKLAPPLATADRVEMFGTDRLKAIYANMPEDDFQQEYEAAYVDEVTAWITWEEIKAAQALGAGLPCILSHNRETVDNARQAIDELAELVRQGKVETTFGAGYDVGRTRNTSELFIVGVSTADSYPVRAAITLDNCGFDEQQDILVYAMNQLPIFSMLIDQNGIGMNLSENMEKLFYGKVQGALFTNANKALWAGDAKMRIQQKKAPLPVNREIAYQIHSIKKIITPAKNIVLDTDRDEKHHADKFWAWALGLTAAGRPKWRSMGEFIKI